MKTFNNLEEMKPYYNKKTNTYEFFENGKRIDIHIDFILKTTKSICARDIKASGIKARNINACDINAWDIEVNDIEACDIEASNIKANNIKAWNIKAWTIEACDIEFYAICFSYKTFICDSIRSRRENSKYFCLDSEVVIKQDM